MNLQEFNQACSSFMLLQHFNVANQLGRDVFFPQLIRQLHSPIRRPCLRKVWHWRKGSKRKDHQLYCALQKPSHECKRGLQKLVTLLLKFMPLKPFCYFSIQVLKACMANLSLFQFSVQKPLANCVQIGRHIDWDKSFCSAALISVFVTGSYLWEFDNRNNC